MWTSSPVFGSLSRHDPIIQKNKEKNKRISPLSEKQRRKKEVDNPVEKRWIKRGRWKEDAEKKRGGGEREKRGTEEGKAVHKTIHTVEKLSPFSQHGGKLCRIACAFPAGVV